MPFNLKIQDVLSEKSLEKIIIARVQAHRKKISASAASKGRKFSEETKKKLSESALRRWNKKWL